MTMLNLLQSPDLNQLADALLKRYREDYRNQIFASATIIIPNFAMADWLSQYIAREQGITAQLNFQLWIEFERQLIESASSHSPQRPLTDIAMRWAIFAYLWREKVQILGNKRHPLHDNLHTLLTEHNNEDIDAQRLWAYASETASIFSGYLAMRPDWLTAWQKTQTPAMPVAEENYHTLPSWLQDHYHNVLLAQHHLWTTLFADSFTHRQQLNTTFTHRIAEQTLANLPKPLYLFATSDYTDEKITFLQTLAQRTDIYLYHHTLSNAFFSDIKDSRWLRSLTDTDKHHLSSGHELVSRFGKQQRDEQRLLEKHHLLDNITRVNPTSPTKDTLLSRLQDDIHRMDERISLTAEPTLPADDDSIQIHGCHGLIRQLEILRSEIVRWLNADPTRQLSDILIVSPKLNEQQNIIRAIFPTNGEYDGYHIPARLTGVASTATENLWLALTAPYSVLKDNFEAQKIYDILLLEDNCHAFKCKPEDLRMLCQSLSANGYRRGFDQEHLRTQLHITDEDPRYTYTYALDRLVTGYSMGEINLYHGNTIPDISIQLKDQPALTALSQFALDIYEARELTTQQHPIRHWISHLKERLQQRFAHTQHTPAYQNILASLRDLHFETYDNDHDCLPLHFILNVIEERLSETYTSAEPSGVITIGRHNSLAKLPYKLIIFIGAENGEFPTHPPERRYNLIDIDNHRPGDRQRDREDLAHFMDLINSAQENFWISYTAIDPDDNEPRLPAQPIQELIHYLEETAPKHLNIHHIHPATPFQTDNNIPPAPLWRNIIAQKNDTGQALSKWTTLPAIASLTAHDPRTLSAPYYKETSPPTLTPLRHLIKDIINPATAYLRGQNIACATEQATPENYEPLSPNALELWKIRETLIHLHQHPEQANTLPYQPILPIGKIGEISRHEQQQQLKKRLTTLGGKPSPTQATQILLDNRLYSHALPINPHTPWYRIHPSTISNDSKNYKINPLLTYYLEHLLWQSQHGKAESICNFAHKNDPNGQNITLAPIKKEDAQQELRRFIALADIARATPWLAPIELLWKITSKKIDDLNPPIKEWINKPETQLDHPDNWQFIFRGYSETEIITAIHSALEAQQHLLDKLHQQCV